MAPGSVASGFAAKFAAASEIASPLFCIPTSMPIAVTFFSSRFNAFAAPVPSTRPTTLWMATTIITSAPQVKIFSALLATILGTLGAIGAFYSKKGMSSAITTMNQVPVVNADVVTGFSVCILLVVVFGVSKDTFLPLIIGHVSLCAPFVFLSVIPKLKQMDPSIYEAALDLGATPLTALVRIVIPQIFPGILSGFALAVTLSLDDYFVATYTKPATFDTISTYVVNATKGAQTTIKTALWALSTVIFLLVVLFTVVMNLRAQKAGQERSGI